MHNILFAVVAPNMCAKKHQILLQNLFKFAFGAGKTNTDAACGHEKQSFLTVI